MSPRLESRQAYDYFDQQSMREMLRFPRLNLQRQCSSTLSTGHALWSLELSSTKSHYPNTTMLKRSLAALPLSVSLSS